MNLKPSHRKKLGTIQNLAKIHGALSDPRWVEVCNGEDEVRIDLGGDRRLVMWREGSGINVGALHGTKTVWDYVEGNFPDAEQAAFDCYQALCLLDDVRVLPNPQAGMSVDRVRRKIRRQLLRALWQWSLVCGAYVIGSALVILSLLSWFLLF